MTDKHERGPITGESPEAPRFGPSAGAFSQTGPSYPQGEILPPVPSAPMRSQPTRNPARRGWAASPATYVLLGVNCAVYLAMALSGVSPVSPQPSQLVHWGATYGEFVLVYGQWWRLVTAMFVHIGFLHLATNMWCLWNLGLLGEPLLGFAGLVWAYLLTGFAGNLLSVALRPGLTDGGSVGAGASGAIFGLAGVLIVLLSFDRLPIPPADRKALRKSVVWFAVLNFVLAAGIDVSHLSLRIDNSAHLGGFLAGLLLAWPMIPRIGAPPALFARRRNLAVIGGTLLLLLLCVGVRAFYLAGAPGN